VGVNSLCESLSRLIANVSLEPKVLVFSIVANVRYGSIAFGIYQSDLFQSTFNSSSYLMGINIIGSTFENSRPTF
jgi:hypothetical protein